MTSRRCCKVDSAFVPARGRRATTPRTRSLLQLCACVRSLLLQRGAILVEPGFMDCLRFLDERAQARRVFHDLGNRAQVAQDRLHLDRRGRLAFARLKIEPHDSKTQAALMQKFSKHRAPTPKPVRAAQSGEPKFSA